MSQGLLVPFAHPLDPERHGSKAARLASLANLGVRVPPGVVIPAPVHAAALNNAAVGPPRVSPALATALRERLASLGPAPWVVRTSASIEDLPHASAAGIFRSELGLRDTAGVVAAVERCWRAAHAERVAIYLAATGRRDGLLPAVAILIQPQVQARWAGVLFTRDPRQGADSRRLLCELVQGSTSAVTAGLMDPAAHALERRGHCAPPLPADAGLSARDLVALADLAEQAVGGPADVELALTGTGAVVLQLRPITSLRSPPVPDDGRQDGLHWRWDAAHNPAPLSSLHASLVARLDRIPALPFRMRCVGGLLYSARRPGARDTPPESAEQIQKAWPKRRREIEARLATLTELDTRRAPLTAVLGAFDGFYERYAALAGAPFARSHRRLAERLDEALARGDLAREHLPDALDGVTTPLTTALTTLAGAAAKHPGLLVPLAEGRDVSAEPGGAALESGLAAVIERLGALPPVWDVAVPTLAESPAALRRTVAALAKPGAPDAVSSAPQAQPARPTTPVTIRSHLWNLAADEEDDLLFARGLAVLRTAFLRAGTALTQAGRLDHPEHVFRLRLPPLLQALDIGRDPNSASDLRTMLAPEDVPAPSGPTTKGLPAHGPLQGLGSGAGVVRAPALVIHRLDGRLDDLAVASIGRIIVCASLLPSAVVLLAGAAGIVTDHGGLLSHGAILARELGLPAVLGTHSATTQINTDDPLWLDAEQGLVIRLPIDQ